MKKSSYLPLILLLLWAIGFSAYKFYYPITITDAELKTLLIGEMDLQYSTDFIRSRTNRELNYGGYLVERHGNTPISMNKLKRAENIKKQTENLYLLLNSMRTSILKSSDKLNNPNNLCTERESDTELCRQHFFNAYKSLKITSQLRNNLPIKQLHTALQSYKKFIAQETGHKDSLLLTNWQHKNLSFDEFEKLYFHAPALLVLANIARMEADVARVENQTVTDLVYTLHNIDISRFDTKKAYIYAESDEIPEGTNYHAKMFLVLTSGKSNPRMAASQGQVVVGKDGIGKLRFVVPKATNYNEKGIAVRKWQGAITIKTADDRDTTFKFDQEYFIRKN